MQKANGVNNGGREIEYFIQKSRERKENIDIGLELLVEDEVNKGMFYGMRPRAQTHYEASSTEGARNETFSSPETDFYRSHILNGKRYRSSSLLEIYEGERGTKLPEALKAALAIEIEHNASLHQDDAIDHDIERHGIATVWYSYAMKELKNKKDPIIARHNESQRELERLYSKKQVSEAELIGYMQKYDIPVRYKKGLVIGDIDPSQLPKYEEIRNFLVQRTTSNLQRLRTECETKGKNDASLFAQYLAGLSERVLHTMNHPKAEEAGQILRAAHNRLTNGEKMEIELISQLKEKKSGFEGVTENDYFDIADSKACLFDAGNEMGFVLAMGEVGNKFKIAMKGPDYVSEQRKLIKEFSRYLDRILQLTDDNLMYSSRRESGKSPYSDLRNMVPTLSSIKLYEELKAKGNGDYKFFVETVGNEKAEEREFKKIVDMMKDYAIDERIRRDYITKYVEGARSKLDLIDLKPESKDFFIGAMQVMVPRRV